MTARILVVDDEERILTALKSLFRMRYHVFATTDGHQALDFLKAEDSVHIVVFYFSFEKTSKGYGFIQNTFFF